ncbi:hypothetical protein ES288_A06G203300v1 [Gossypium darwinii]|uniref:DUF547 domain-containing protein n=1 Tax=Gossypium darwinii TaxID=34276 RepID=A0A5D2G7Z9_GOSDA|nr:hypothetical protein ES288_A06G203300v1 [Gossypium darwinii]
MKFEDFLMERTEEKKKKIELQERRRERSEQGFGGGRLEASPLSLSQQPPCSHRCFRLKRVQALLAELATVEEEIVWLERKIDDLKMKLYQEKKLTQQWKIRQQQNQLICKPPRNDDDDLNQRTRSQNYDILRKGELKAIGEPPWLCFFFFLAGEVNQRSKKLQTWRIQKQCPIINDKPNELSEELQGSQDKEGSAIVAKLSFSCMASRGYSAKNSLINFKSPIFGFNQNSSNIDPYGIIPEFDGLFRDIGDYKNFIQITRHSFDLTRFSDCLAPIGKLRILLHRLSNVDLTFLTYKQKLAFWINIYNACIMHVFLEHGLPSTQEKLLALMNKAALNVGGIVLNALAIEHFILRHPCESEYGPMDEKEMLLRHAYGLGYPEPNVTFALCRGTWSSPALRIYTADEVVNELGKAKVDYLEASVGITSKKKVSLPKLLQWHMKDFADDMESLVEWVYSQLPRSGSLKTSIMDCLNKESKYQFAKMVEVQHYESEFRYLLSCPYN